MNPKSRQITRRVVVARAVAAAAAGACGLPASPARATPEAMQGLIRLLVGEAPVQEGRVKLDAPPLVENGNTVPITIAVESPMSPTDHVTSIHVFNEKNPQPHVLNVMLGPRAGRASIAARIKLADTQRIVAIAQMSDGTFWSGSADVIVTIAACLEIL